MGRIRLIARFSLILCQLAHVYRSSFPPFRPFVRILRFVWASDGEIAAVFALFVLWMHWLWRWGRPLGINVEPSVRGFPNSTNNFAYLPSKLNHRWAPFWVLHPPYSPVPLVASTMSGKKKPGPAASSKAQVCHCLSSVVDDTLMREKRPRSSKPRPPLLSLPKRPQRWSLPRPPDLLPRLAPSPRRQLRSFANRMVLHSSMYKNGVLEL